MALINRIVLGTRPFIHINEKEVFKILEHFFSCGGQYVDTAYFYGYGRIAKLIGAFNKLYNPKAIYIYKIGYFSKASDYRNIDILKLAIEEACTNLFSLPRYVLLHEADWSVWWRKTNRLGTLISLKNATFLNLEIYEKLCDFLKSLSILPGISGNNTESLAILLHIQPKMILLSKQYDLLWKNAQSLMHYQGLLLLGSPFHQGWIFKLKELAQRLPQINHDIKKLKKIFDSHSYALDHLALNFCLQTTKGKVVFGVESKEQLIKNLDNMNQPLPQELILKLKKINIIQPPMPGPLAINRST